MQYKISAVHPDIKEINGKFGPTKVYKLRLEGLTDTVDLMVGSGKPAPQVGEQLDGSVEHNDFGHYFKKDKVAYTPRAGGGGGSQKAAGSSHTFYVSYAKDLLVSYLEAIQWDFTKFDDKVLQIAINEVIGTAKKLQDSDSPAPVVTDTAANDTSITPKDLTDSWGLPPEETVTVPEGF